jgi:hypothetical protein
MDQGGDRGITLIHREVGMRKSDHWSQAVFPETERDLGQELDSVELGGQQLSIVSLMIFGWLVGCLVVFCLSLIVARWCKMPCHRWDPSNCPLLPLIHSHERLWTLEVNDPVMLL